MTTVERADRVARDTILKMLSDEENAKVSRAEGAAGLPDGEEYVDLEHLEAGVQLPSLRPRWRGARALRTDSCALPDVAKFIYGKMKNAIDAAAITAVWRLVVAAVQVADALRDGLLIDIAGYAKVRRRWRRPQQT